VKATWAEWRMEEEDGVGRAEHGMMSAVPHLWVACVIADVMSCDVMCAFALAV